MNISHKIRHITFHMGTFGLIALLLSACGLIPGFTNTPASSSTTQSNGAQSGGAPVATVVVSPADDVKSLCFNAKPPNTTPPANAPHQFGSPAQVIDPTHTYCAFLTTAHGVIVVELYANVAPKHVNSFVFLASQGFFDGLTWHRVIAGFVAQTGDPTGTGGGGPGYSVPLEASPNLHYDRPGILGMARTSDPNSAGSQFFITYAPAANLDVSADLPGYTIFGRVVRGMEVVQQIRPRDQGEPPGDALISVRTLDAGVTPR